MFAVVTINGEVFCSIECLRHTLGIGADPYRMAFRDEEPTCGHTEDEDA